MTVPLCECHGLPMYPSGRRFRCAERKREQSRLYYATNREQVSARRIARWVDKADASNERRRKAWEELSGLEYNWQLLRLRRKKGLGRIQERRVRREGGE